MSQPLRVYLPATVTILGTLHTEGSFAAARAYAVTPDLRADAGETDEEELAYAAYRLAADASLELLRADPSAPRRRVVISADVPAAVVPGGEPGAVRLTGPVPAAAVAAIHIDGAAAEPAVTAALAGDRAGSGGEPAGTDDQLAGPDDELEWYDVTELPQLVA